MKTFISIFIILVVQEAFGQNSRIEKIKDRDSCKVRDKATNRRVKCQFPFKFKGRTHNGCIDYTPKKKDPGTWVFRFRTFNLNHSWILSQLSYERVLYL